jgi:hypothetical protein
MNSPWLTPGACHEITCRLTHYAAFAHLALARVPVLSEYVCAHARQSIVERKGESIEQRMRRFVWNENTFGIHHTLAELRQTIGSSALLNIIDHILDDSLYEGKTVIAHMFLNGDVTDVLFAYSYCSRPIFEGGHTVDVLRYLVRHQHGYYEILCQMSEGYMDKKQFDDIANKIGLTPV